MIKGELIELASTLMQRSDDTLNFDKRIIEYTIASVYYEMYYKNYLVLKDNIDYYSKIYELEINFIYKDEILKEVFAEIPINTVDLPIANKGIISIHLKDNPDNLFIPISFEKLRHFNEMEISLISNNIYYTIVGKKIYFTKNLTEDIVDNNEVVIVLIPAFEDLEYDDEVYIPAGSYMSLLQTAFPVITSMPNTDLNNNNNDK